MKNTILTILGQTLTWLMLLARVTFFILMGLCTGVKLLRYVCVGSVFYYVATFRAFTIWQAIIYILFKKYLWLL